MRCWTLAIVIAAAGSVCCSEKISDAAPASVSTSEAAPPSASPAPIRELPALSGEWLAPLRDLGEHPAGMIAIPIGAREPRPLVVAVHGAEARPDEICGIARASIGPRAFVVCPHPVDTFHHCASWGDPANLRRAIERSVAAAIDRYGAYLDVSDSLYFAHSQGAMLGPAALALPGATHFRRAILYEGLPKDPVGARRDLLRAHVERLLVVSGQPGWRGGHRSFAASFDGSPVTARHLHGNFGHFFGADVHALLLRELPWVVDDSTSWE